MYTQKVYMQQQTTRKIVNFNTSLLERRDLHVSGIYSSLFNLFNQLWRIACFKAWHNHNKVLDRLIDT